MGWRRFPILWALILLSILAAPPRARAVTYEYDEQDRLVRAAWANGTLVEYAYDPAGNRVSRTILSARPPEISFEPLQGFYTGESWDNQRILRGTAAAKSGYELKRVDVSVGRMGEGKGHGTHRHVGETALCPGVGGVAAEPDVGHEIEIGQNRQAALDPAGKDPLGIP